MVNGQQPYGNTRVGLNGQLSVTHSGAFTVHTTPHTLSVWPAGTKVRDQTADFPADVLVLFLPECIAVYNMSLYDKNTSGY